MSHPSKIDILRQAKAAGFFVQLYFVGIDDPSTNVARIAARVAEGGHDVPEDRIVARWHRTMGFLVHAVRAADRSFVFDNSRSWPAGRGPRLVLDIETSKRLRNARSIRQIPPIPEWVRSFLLHTLGMEPKSTS
jgi:predicted ABC-type ATPase